MAKSKKARLIQQLNEMGITPSPKTTVAEMEQFIKDNEGGKGYIIRPIKPSRRIAFLSVEEQKLFEDMQQSYWVADDEWGQRLLKSRMFGILDRAFRSQVSNDVRVIETPART